MHRPILFIGTCLCLVAAGVLIAGAGLLSPGATARPPAAYEEITRGFYDAVNAAIETGDSSLVRAFVDEDFFGGEGLPGVAPGRAGLEATLADLHATAPDTRLGVETLSISGDRVTVDLAIHGEQGGSFLGVPLVAPPLPWGTVDVIRIRAGKIVERRSLADGTGMLRPTVSSPLQLNGPIRRVVTLERLILPPGEASPLPKALGARVLLFEAGVVHVEQTTMVRIESATPVPDVKDAAAPFLPSTRVRDLANEEIIVVPAGDQAKVTNRGRTVASLLSVSMHSPVVGGAAAGTERTKLAKHAVEHQVLAGGTAVNLPDGPLGIAAGHVVLAPGAALALGASEGAVLVRLDAGEVNVSHQGPVRFRQRDGGVLTGSGTEQLDSSEGMLIEPGASVVIANDSGQTVQALVVTVTGSGPEWPGSQGEGRQSQIP